MGISIHNYILLLDSYQKYHFFLIFYDFTIFLKYLQKYFCIQINQITTP